MAGLESSMAGHGELVGGGKVEAGEGQGVWLHPVHCGQEGGGAMGEGVELGPAACSPTAGPSLLLA
jgi:hypothetical protein